MSGRETIRANIRKALGVTGDQTAREAVVAERLERAPAGVIPKRGQLPLEDQVKLFSAMLEKAYATTARLTDASEVPAAVAAYLRNNNLPARLRRGTDPRLAGLDWSSTQVEIDVGAAVDADAIGLSHAETAIAEAGILMLTSGPDNPTSVNFLPDTHIVVVRAEDVTGDYEAAWHKIRAIYGKGTLPRTINMVAGPSRSGDIQQTMLLGAHGPRALHVLIVG